MMYKVSAAFIMSISVVLALASNQAFGQSGAVQAGRAASVQTFQPLVTRSLHHNRRNMLHHNRRNIQPFFNGGFCCEILEWPTRRRPRTSTSDDRRFSLHIQK